MVVFRRGLLFHIQPAGEDADVFGRVLFELGLQFHKHTVEVHAVKQVGGVVVGGDGVEVLGQDEGALAPPQEAVADRLSDVDAGAHAVRAGAVAVVRAPVGQPAHRAVDPGTVYAEAPYMVVHQVGGVLLIAGMVVVHRDAVPFVL